MRLVLVGFGVVAQAFTKMIAARRDQLLRGYGLNPRIVAAIDRRGYAADPKGLRPEQLIEEKASKGSIAEKELATRDVQARAELIREIDADVVIETTPTNLQDGQPGITHIEKALAGRKHVITTNKGPLALALPALTELAEHNGVELRFSATVGGGTPVLEFAKRCLSADRLLSLQGILNGTTNFILTQMGKQGISFEDALATAQRLGYAEADPTLDVEGYDTACKVVIIANWLFHRRVTLKDVRIQGIRGITQKQVQDAAARQRALKLLGFVDTSLRVEPTEIPFNDPICVEGTLNAVRFHTEYAGEEIIIGKGAGGMETASAVLRDLLTIRDRMSEELRS